MSNQETDPINPVDPYQKVNKPVRDLLPKKAYTKIAKQDPPIIRSERDLEKERQIRANDQSLQTTKDRQDELIALNDEALQRYKQKKQYLIDSSNPTKKQDPII